MYEGNTRVDLFDVVKACFRRWYVLLPLLAATAWYSHQVYAAAQPVYYGQAVVGLAPPSFRVDTAVTGQPIARNGLLDIGGAPLLANMTALGVREPAVVNRVVALGGMPDYTARLFPVPPTAPPIPLVMIEDSSPDPESTTKTLELVTKEISTSLENLQKQANVPPEMMVETFVVSAPSTPIAAMPSRTRSTASIFVAGLGLTVVVTVLVDVLLGRAVRRRKSAVSPQPPSDDEDRPTPESGSVTTPSTTHDVPERVGNDAADAR